jgi:hypothetical protein
MVWTNGHGEASCDLQWRSGLRSRRSAQAVGYADRRRRRSRRPCRATPVADDPVAAAVGAFATRIGVLGSEEAKRLDREEESGADDDERNRH